MKVYVDEMPESCWKCENYLCKNNNFLTNVFTGEVDKKRDCPLHSLKDHDRELVKQVFKKIKEQFGFIIDGKERIICDGSVTGDKTILAILNQIEKEYEK